MIIGISGSQGQGKTTLINAAIKQNSRFIAPTIQTSRNILNSWGFSLNEVNKYMPLKVKFQEQLLHDHQKSLKNLNSGIHLVERTFADIYAYALVSLGPFNEYSEWLDTYYYACLKAQQELFDHVVYLSGRTYVPENDGVRSTNVHFAKLIDDTIYRLVHEFHVANLKRISFVTFEDLSERVDMLNNVIDNFKGESWRQG